MLMPVVVVVATGQRRGSRARLVIALLIVLIIACPPAAIVVEASPLHPQPPQPDITRGTYIGYHEAVWYDTALLLHHQRRRRDVVQEPTRDRPLVVRLNTKDTKWTLKLTRDDGLFADDVQFEGGNGPIAYDTSNAFHGSVLEDDSAFVQGVITEDGLFDGTLVTRFEELYIEPASRYLVEGEGNTSPTYHTIVYRASDVTQPPRPNDCPSHRLHTTGGLTFNNSTVVKPSNVDENWTGNNYDVPLVDRKERRKRAIVDSRKTTCMLYLQADHQFFSRYRTEEACIEVMTRHVQRVNSIYKHTDFNQDGKPDNIGFMIKRIKVHGGDAARDPNYRFPGNYGVEKFLELFSEEDYDAFCLAYMFTYRDFEMGTLGLAWTGDLKNAGGVCERNGHYRGSLKSLNTGIVTLLNYGKHVPPAVSHVTLAHEIGHNFGSPHDPEQCTPGGEDGNFIMFARATSGDKRNNNRFSPCSLNAINPVLNSKARSQRGCFTEPQVSLCGNGVVEEGEECDCGWEEDCKDSCCFPQRRYPPPDEVPCTLTPGTICSPSQGPCCTNECKLKFGDKCRDDNGCRDTSFCDGRSPRCPPSINKPNKTICNREFVCFMGECTGSICLAYGLESCQCIPGPNDPPTKACELCCRLPGEHQPCLSSFDWNSPPFDVPDMFSKPGTPCNDYNGYCDVFQKCREVDPSGPLATLRKLLLSEESLATFRRWAWEHWYAVALLAVAAISVLIASTRLLAKRSDLKLKSVTIIHSSTTETVRLPPEGTGGVTVHPPAVRAKLPLSRKVREKRHRRNKHKDKNTTESNKAKKKENDKKKQNKRPATTSTEEPARKKHVEAPQPLATATATTTTTTAVAPEQKQKASGSSPTTATTTNDTSLSASNNNNNNDNKPPRKQKKRKRRSNNNNNNNNSKKNKEVIDYSAAQADTDPDTSNTDPKTKVRSWLLASQCRVEPRPLANNNNNNNGTAAALPKSKSTPVALTAAAAAARQAASPRKSMLDPKVVVKSNNSDKARMQVVYKPPFRFSVKLRKADKVAQTAAQPSSSSNNNNLGPRAGVLFKTSKPRARERTKLSKSKETSSSSSSKRIMGIDNHAAQVEAATTSDIHTVPSDLEVLLSESEFLFCDS